MTIKNQRETIAVTERAGRARRVLASALLLVSLQGLVTAQESVGSAAESDRVEVGRRIYRDGILHSGRALVGTGQTAGVVLSGADAACVTCHRRSGYGSSEGPIEVRPITGSALWLPNPESQSSA